MELKYVLAQMAGKVAKMRKAQKDYYAYKGDPRTDPLKKSYLQEAQRREEDVDRFMTQLPIMVPDLATDLAKASA